MAAVGCAIGARASLAGEAASARGGTAVATAADLPHGKWVIIDWPGLRAAAVAAAERAYAPYSRLRVGAAGLAGDGRVVTGCNVENASFGLTLCAECGLVSALYATAPASPSIPDTASPPGAPLTSETPSAPRTRPVSAAGPVLVAVAVVAGDGNPLLPCGRCRQLLLEAGGPDLLVDAAPGPVPLAALLPAAFGGADVSSRADRER